MDPEIVKAPIPIERLARRLRTMRLALHREWSAGPTLSLTADFDALLVEAAAMLEVPVPRRAVFAGGGYHYDARSRARAEEALAGAGLDVRSAKS